MTDTDIPPWLPPHRRCGVHELVEGAVVACQLPRDQCYVHRVHHLKPPPPDHRLLVSISPGERDTVYRAHCPECEFALTAVVTPRSAWSAVAAALDECHGHVAMIERSDR